MDGWTSWRTDNEMDHRTVEKKCGRIDGPFNKDDVLIYSI